MAMVGKWSKWTIESIAHADNNLVADVVSPVRSSWEQCCMGVLSSLNGTFATKITTVHVFLLTITVNHKF